VKKILHVAETIKGGVATVIRTISASPEGDADELRTGLSGPAGSGKRTARHRSAATDPHLRPHRAQRAVVAALRLAI
jgi:hypothetical protein